MFHPSGFKSNFQKEAKVKIKNYKIEKASKIAREIFFEKKDKSKIIYLGLKSKLIYLFSKMIPLKLQIKFWNIFVKKLT